MANGICLTPPASCDKWIFQSPGEQRFLLLQLLNALQTSPQTLDELKTDSDGWWCQGSPAKLRALQAQMVGDGLEGAVTVQPVCWTPLQLEGAISYLYCKLLAQIAG
jgi:hypothetical protein